MEHLENISAGGIRTLRWFHYAERKDNAVFSYVTRNENKKNRCILSKNCPAQALKLQPFVHSAQGTLTLGVHIMQYDERERKTFSRFKKSLKKLSNVDV